MRTLSVAALAVLTATSFALGERKKLRPLVTASKLECHVSRCLSLSSTILASDACFNVHSALQRAIRGVHWWELVE